MTLAHEWHYEPKTLAELWGLSPTKVRRMFAERIGENERDVSQTQIATKGEWVFAE